MRPRISSWIEFVVRASARARQRGLKPALQTCLAAVLLICCGCNKNDSEHLGRVGHTLGNRFHEMLAGREDSLAASWQAIRGNWNEGALDVRVQARLHWDKDLADQTIKVSTEDGIVTLRGKVASDSQKQAAVRIAQETIGVERVEDELEIEAP
jgi:BON domain